MARPAPPESVPDDEWGARRAARRTLPPGFRADAWRVRREFLRIPDPLPPPPFKEAERVEDALGRVVKALGVPEVDPDALRIERVWAEAVGPTIAAHASPGGLENGTLAVLVKGSTWLAELRRTAPRHLPPKLNAALGAPADRPVVRAVRLALAR